MKSLLTPSQCEELEKAGLDVRLSVDLLVGLVKKHVTSEDIGGKVRRMLPAVPGGGKGLVRAHSARVRSADRSRVTRRLSMIDSTKSEDV